MYEFTITFNANADNAYFDYVMRGTYPTYDGYEVHNSTYITVVTTEEFTSQQKAAVTYLYSVLTVDDKIENKHCIIYDYIAPFVNVGIDDKTLPPCHIDYRVATMKRLPSLVTNIYKGEVREITYYADITVNPDTTITGVTPVVKEEITYHRDVAKMVIYRVMKIWWYLKDGTEFSTHKERVKYYTPEEKIMEGQRLRKNIIDYCQPKVLGMIMATEDVDYDTAVTLGAQLSNKYSSEMSSWVTSSRGNPLIQIVTDDTEILWLDNVVNQQGTTIRDYILDQLNY